MLNRNLTVGSMGDKYRSQSLNETDSLEIFEGFMLGADISSLPQVEAENASFYHDGTEESVFSIMTVVGFKWARLRLWIDPGSSDVVYEDYCDLTHTLAMATRIKEEGWNLLLDIHYSDRWADPANQVKPASWAALNFDDLVAKVYNYTYDVLSEFQAINATPDMVQVGNEISHGFLWPEGSISNFDDFTTLLDAGITAVKDHNTDTGYSTKIMLHHAPGANCSGYVWWLDNLLARNISFDIVGYSYYPRWHGSLSNLEDMLFATVTNYSLDVVVVETAYPFTFDWVDNTTNNFWIDSLHPGYDSSPEGQRAFFSAIINILLTLPDEQGRGLFLWEPIWVAPADGGTSMENTAIFDFDHDLLDVYDIPLIVQLSPITSTDTNTSTDSNTDTNSNVPTDSDLSELDDGENLRIIPGYSVNSLKIFSFGTLLIILISVIKLKQEKR